MTLSLLTAVSARDVRVGDRLPEFRSHVTRVTHLNGRVQLWLSSDGGLGITVDCEPTERLDVARGRRAVA